MRPNVRTYTALITAMANAHEWERAVDTLRRMKQDSSWRRVEPNAYTYSALLKLLGGSHMLICFNVVAGAYVTDMRVGCHQLRAGCMSRLWTIIRCMH